jgi:hypothetical protein
MESNLYKKQLFNTLKPGDVFCFIEPTVYLQTTIRVYLGDSKWLTPSNTVGHLVQTLPVTNVFAYVLQDESDTVNITP